MTKRMRRIARIWGVAIIAIALFFAIGHVIWPEPKLGDHPWISLPGLLVEIERDES